jgi:hypothetical protein
MTPALSFHYPAQNSSTRSLKRPLETKRRHRGYLAPFLSEGPLSSQQHCCWKRCDGYAVLPDAIALICLRWFLMTGSVVAAKLFNSRFCAVFEAFSNSAATFSWPLTISDT